MACLIIHFQSSRYICNPYPTERMIPSIHENEKWIEYLKELKRIHAGLTKSRLLSKNHRNPPTALSQRNETSAQMIQITNIPDRCSKDNASVASIWLRRSCIHNAATAVFQDGKKNDYCNDIKPIMVALKMIFETVEITAVMHQIENKETITQQVKVKSDKLSAFNKTVRFQSNVYNKFKTSNKVKCINLIVAVDNENDMALIRIKETDAEYNETKNSPTYDYILNFNQFYRLNIEYIPPNIQPNQPVPSETADVNNFTEINRIIDNLNTIISDKENISLMNRYRDPPTLEDSLLNYLDTRIASQRFVAPISIKDTSNEVSEDNHIHEKANLFQDVIKLNYTTIELKAIMAVLIREFVGGYKPSNNTSTPDGESTPDEKLISHKEVVEYVDKVIASKTNGHSSDMEHTDYLKYSLIVTANIVGALYENLPINKSSEDQMSAINQIQRFFPNGTDVKKAAKLSDFGRIVAIHIFENTDLPTEHQVSGPTAINTNLFKKEFVDISKLNTTILTAPGGLRWVTELTVDYKIVEYLDLEPIMRVREDETYWMRTFDLTKETPERIKPHQVEKTHYIPVNAKLKQRYAIRFLKPYAKLEAIAA